MLSCRGTSCIPNVHEPTPHDTSSLCADDTYVPFHEADACIYIQHVVGGEVKVVILSLCCVSPRILR